MNPDINFNLLMPRREHRYLSQ